MPLYRSCTPNCAVRFIGDFMLVFTTRAVAPAEHLHLRYIDIHAPFPERAKVLGSWSGGQGFAGERRPIICGLACVVGSWTLGHLGPASPGGSRS